ncbi:MAG: hypothetical protein ABJQ39_12830 [Winogradskyella arenosi]
MKKKLESELVSIAHRILKLSGREDLSKLHEEVALLYEKLTVLKFAEENFEDKIPKIGNDSSFFSMLETAFNNKFSDNIEVEDKTYIHLDEKEDDGIMEPVMTKIKDLVAQMPEDDEAQADVAIEQPKVEAKAPTPKQPEAPKPTESLFEQDLPKDNPTTPTLQFDDITSGFDTIPEFEPIEEAKKREAETASKSLNDRLKGQNLKIGLNDKLAFIKHLFEGESESYDRVISQINTTSSLSEAKTLISEMVKPDYNNWEGKEEYEERFLQLIEGKYN